MPQDTAAIPVLTTPNLLEPVELTDYGGPVHRALDRAYFCL